MHSEITISQADHRPMYLQIMEQIRHRVAIGDWQAGQEIPSIRTARLLGMSGDELEARMRQMQQKAKDKR